MNATSDTASSDRNDEGQHRCDRVAKLARTKFIDGDLVKRLSLRRPSAVLLRIGFDYTLVFTAVVVSELYLSLVVYVLALVTIGARFSGIGSVALHDGAHGLLIRDRRLNDLLGRLLGLTVGVPILEEFEHYRKRHLAHHRSTNTEGDPDAWMHDKVYGTPAWKGVLFLILALSGVIFLKMFFAFLVRLSKSNRVVLLGVLGFVVVLAIGVAIEFYPAVLFLKYWVIPLATWGVFVNLIRGVAEHYPLDEFQRGADFPEVFRSRDVLNTWFDQFFVVTRCVNFHLAHHLFPSVPFYNLPQLQRALAKSEQYSEYAHVTRGYHQFLLEYFFQRSKLAGLDALSRAK